MAQFVGRNLVFALAELAADLNALLLLRKLQKLLSAEGDQSPLNALPAAVAAVLLVGLLQDFHIKFTEKCPEDFSRRFSLVNQR